MAIELFNKFISMTYDKLCEVGVAQQDYANYLMNSAVMIIDNCRTVCRIIFAKANSNGKYDSGYCVDVDSKTVDWTMTNINEILEETAIYHLEIEGINNDIFLMKKSGIRVIQLDVVSLSLQNCDFLRVDYLDMVILNIEGYEFRYLETILENSPELREMLENKSKHFCIQSSKSEKIAKKIFPNCTYYEV